MYVSNFPFIFFSYFHLYIGMNSNSTISTDTIIKNLLMTVLISIVESTFTIENIDILFIS